MRKFPAFDSLCSIRYTLENIKKEWITKNKEGIKGKSDIEAGHRTNFSERCQKCMNEVMNLIGEVLNDPDAKSLWDANTILFDAPNFVYITIPKK